MGQLAAFLIGGGLIGIFDFVLKWRTSKREVTRSDFDRALALIDQLQEDNETLRQNLRKVELRYHERDCDVLDLRLGILVLIEQLREMGVQLRWGPTYPHAGTEQKKEAAEG